MVNSYNSTCAIVLHTLLCCYSLSTNASNCRFCRFLWLSRDQQDHLASLIGTTTNVIISSLAYTQSMVLVF